MNMKRLFEWMLALGVPRVATDANGNAIGLARPDGSLLPLAMVYAFPSTPQVYTSPIAGEPDTASSLSSGLLAGHPGTGFLLPKSGILTDIGFIAQGNAGAGVSQRVYWYVATIENDPAAKTGLKIGEVLDTGYADVADNFNGNVALATGKTLAVPSQFMLFVKSDFGTGIKVQLMNSAGPVPGVIGGITGSTLITAATYTTDIVDFASPPDGVIAGTKLRGLTYKALSTYIKWKGQ